MAITLTKITIGRISDLYNAIYGQPTQQGRQGGIITGGTPDLPTALSLHIGRVGKALEHEFTNFEERRIELVKKYGTELEGGGFSVEKAPKEDIDKFYKEYGELASTEVALDIPAIPFKYFDDPRVPNTPEFQAVANAMIDFIAFE